MLQRHRPPRPRPTAALLTAAFTLAASGCADDLGASWTSPDATQGDTGGAHPHPDADADADLAADGRADAGSTADALPDASAAGCESGPPHPIVLVHGMFGFDHLAGIAGLPYYYGVREALEEAGEAVFVTEVSPFDDSDVRGARLLESIEGYTAENALCRVNLVAHSQGGLDARWVAHHRPDLVASVVTIGTPHRGTPIADIVLELVESELLRDLIDALVRLVGRPLFDELGERSSVFAALELFSEPGIAAFNARIVDRAGVYYASIAGRTDGHPGGPDCVAAAVAPSPSFVARWASTVDAVDPLLSLTSWVLEEGDLDRPNDGLVQVASARWGEFLGCVPADHMDEVGQVLDDAAAGGWDHRAFYVGLAGHLRARGL